MMQNQTAPTHPQRALVIDDHPMFCDALELTLRNAAAFEDVATADSLTTGLEVLSRDGPRDLIVLDLNLPDVSGFDGLIRMRTQAPDTPVIVVSSMAENAIISAAIDAGASGYVPKHAPHSEFRAALDAIAQGSTYLPEQYVECPQPSDRADAVTRLRSLTAQQARILELICDGKLNKQIAFDLSIAETTVKAHVTAIMRKLAVQSRTQAVLVAQQAKFAAILPSADA
ncbi:Transcriptional regulatory protein DegU [Rhodobacteraceae bacterium THAF1]|uniref:response regulator n=1 Tax=Palleronia sp. THAF1 TaxID=2587842 RepID=UPI000F3CC6F5|nr:Transcriptional regulatory protein DegU [Palleronia sp. THAF1]VDC24071.1 Transcriptional regulatory protein DegU [Rhodobacteraceae bacterium THAF1]